MEIENKRSYNLDFLKIVSAIMIFLHHYQQTFGVHFSSGVNFYKGYFVFGYIVELFFIISGFLMFNYILVIQNNDTQFDSWIGHRLLRLLPMVTVSVIVYSVADFFHLKVLGYTLEYDNGFSIFRTVVAALGMQGAGAFKNWNINNPLWYVSVLILCYCWFFVLTKLSKRISCKPYYLYLAMVFVGILVLENDITKPFFSYNEARGYYSFFFGLLLAQYINTYGVGKIEVCLSAFVLLISTLFVIFKQSYDLKELGYSCTFLIYPSIIFISETSALKRLLTIPALKTIGNISFNLYLWHVPLFIIGNLIVKSCGINIDVNNAAFMYLALAICSVWSIISHFCIERKLNVILTRVLNDIKTRRISR